MIPLRRSAAPGAPALALGVWRGVKGGGRGPPLLGAAGKILKSIVLARCAGGAACCAGGAGAVRRGRHAPCPLAAQGDVII